jgi:PIN domain nuclease of toxin-antitoxin system
MKLLLDTHAFLWYISNDPRLPRYAYDAVRDKSNEVYLSVVSVWEILVKNQIGKLALPERGDQFVETSRAEHRMADLPLDRVAVSRLLSLPMHHRDPFDRMLICQALTHDLTIVTMDEMFKSYPANLLGES